MRKDVTVLAIRLSVSSFYFADLGRDDGYKCGVRARLNESWDGALSVIAL
jgi:hypothetical protein